MNPRRGVTNQSNNILETIEMIEKYRLDIRTVTMGINLMPCIRETMEATAEAVFERVVAVSYTHLTLPTKA